MKDIFSIFNYFPMLYNRRFFCKEELEKGKCSDLRKRACMYRYECNLGYRNKKYTLCRKDFEIYKNDIHLLPTIRTVINDRMYTEKNFSIEFHFLVFHARLLFVKE